LNSDLFFVNFFRSKNEISISPAPESEMAQKLTERINVMMFLCSLMKKTWLMEETRKNHLTDDKIKEIVDLLKALDEIIDSIAIDLRDDDDVLSGYNLLYPEFKKLMSCMMKMNLQTKRHP